MEPDLRDQIVDFINRWSLDIENGFKKCWLIKLIGIQTSKIYSWFDRYGKDNSHNGKIPRDFWIHEWEKQKIIEYYKTHLTDGYRRITYMMLDEDIVAVSPSTTYSVLEKEGLLRKWNEKKSLKGSGFYQPLKPHEHWHIDVSYLNICSTFYYFIGVLDGCSRSIVHWDIRTSMTEDDIALVLQKAKEKYPNATPRIISDNGPQFIAKDFKEFIRISGMTHVRTSPYYPQSNGKLERYHRTMKHECIRPKSPVSLEDAKRIVRNFIEYYNTKRLHSALGYVTPFDTLNGNQQKIFDARDQKLETARQNRKLARDCSQRAFIENNINSGTSLV